jgi:hypothetical protein
LIQKKIEIDKNKGFQWKSDILKTTDEITYLNFGKFDRVMGQFILCGGTSKIVNGIKTDEGNEAKIFNILGDHFVTFRGFTQGINYGCFSSSNNKVALVSQCG